MKVGERLDIEKKAESYEEKQKEIASEKAEEFWDDVKGVPVVGDIAKGVETVGGYIKDTVLAFDAPSSSTLRNIANQIDVIQNDLGLVDRTKVTGSHSMRVAYGQLKDSEKAEDEFSRWYEANRTSFEIPATVAKKAKETAKTMGIAISKNYADDDGGRLYVNKNKESAMLKAKEFLNKIGMLKDAASIEEKKTTFKPLNFDKLEFPEISLSLDTPEQKKTTAGTTTAQIKDPKFKDIDFKPIPTHPEFSLAEKEKKSKSFIILSILSAILFIGYALGFIKIKGK